MKHNNCVVLNSFFLLSSLLSFRNLFHCFLDRTLSIKAVWLPLASFYLRGPWMFNILLHASETLCNPFSFSSRFTLPISHIKSVIYHFKNICSLYNALLSVELSNSCLHNSDCQLVKIRQTCFNYTRALKTLQFIRTYL